MLKRFTGFQCLSGTSLSLRRACRTNHSLRKLRDVPPGKRSVKTAHFCNTQSRSSLSAPRQKPESQADSGRRGLKIAGFLKADGRAESACCFCRAHHLTLASHPPSISSRAVRPASRMQGSPSSHACTAAVTSNAPHASLVHVRWNGVICPWCNV